MKRTSKGKKTAAVVAPPSPSSRVTRRDFAPKPTKPPKRSLPTGDGV